MLLDGAEQGRTPLRLRYEPGRAHVIGLRLDGHEPRDERLPPGDPRRELHVTLAARGPAGSLTVASSYPVDVIWQGRVLAKGQAQATVSLPAGPQRVTLVAAEVFLNATFPVQVQGGAEVSLQAPGLGRLNVRATPDNCEVLINGTFADYPPILDRRVAAGRLTVTFKWPDGARKDEAVELRVGAIEYVSGRKD